MPAFFRIYPDLELLVTRLVGDVSAADFRGVYERVRAAPGFSPLHAELSDFRPARRFGFDHREMARLALTVSDLHWDQRVRTAIVASPGLGFGMARTYQSYAQTGQVETVELFETPEGALDWLGVAARAAEVLDFGEG